MSAPPAVVWTNCERRPFDPVEQHAHPPALHQGPGRGHLAGRRPQEPVLGSSRCVTQRGARLQTSVHAGQVAHLSPAHLWGADPGQPRQRGESDPADLTDRVLHGPLIPSGTSASTPSTAGTPAPAPEPPLAIAPPHVGPAHRRIAPDPVRGRPATRAAPAIPPPPRAAPGRPRSPPPPCPPHSDPGRRARSARTTTPGHRTPRGSPRSQLAPTSAAYVHAGTGAGRPEDDSGLFSHQHRMTTAGGGPPRSGSPNSRKDAIPRGRCQRQVVGSVG